MYKTNPQNHNLYSNQVQRKKVFHQYNINLSIVVSRISTYKETISSSSIIYNQYNYNAYWQQLGYRHLSQVLYNLLSNQPFCGLKQLTELQFFNIMMIRLLIQQDKYYCILKFLLFDAIAPTVHFASAARFRQS